MHLAYLDDSDTKAKQYRWQVMSAVIIEDRCFKLAEVGVAIVPEILIPADRLNRFEEFHACELYGGFGIFEGIDQTIRFEAIQRLLAVIQMMEIPIVYGAVDLDKLKGEVYASADPVDITFRMCMKGIERCADQIGNENIKNKLGENIDNYTLENISPHIVENMMSKLVIVIVDECEGKIRNTLQKSFRSLRPPKRHGDEQWSCFHDDMYFGDSRYSIGIQLADLCSYFIARHLEGDQEISGFYEIIEPHIVFSEIHPTSLVNIAKTDVGDLDETAPVKANSDGK